tara:strand:+ start:4006 stop:4746 length:741 start_codon:yes stop_codon:yes gene_type:complete
MKSIEKDKLAILEQRGLIKGLSKSAKILNKKIKDLVDDAEKEKAYADSQRFHLANDFGDSIDRDKREAALKLDLCKSNFHFISVLESQIKEESAKLSKMKEDFKNKHGELLLKKIENELQIFGNEKHRQSKDNFKKQNEVNKSLIEIAKILSSKRLFKIIEYKSDYSQLKEKLIIISNFKELAIQQKGNNNENNIIRYLVKNNKEAFIETANLFINSFVPNQNIDDYNKLERYFLIVQNNLKNIEK